MQVTKSGMVQLQNELIRVEEERKSALHEVAAARLVEKEASENGALSNARNNLAAIESRCINLKTMIEKAEIVEDVTEKGTIGIGATLTLEDSDGDKFVVEIVSDGSSDPLNNKVSMSSPIVKACTNVKIGEKFEVEVGENVTTYTLVDIGLVDKEYMLVGEVCTDEIAQKYIPKAQRNTRLSYRPAHA